MDKINHLIDLLSRFGNDTYFVGKANNLLIELIEKLLSLKIPESYKWFLEMYGHGGVTGLEINGNGLANVPSCVSASLNWREFGLPEYLLVIEDSGSDFIFCLDTSRMVNGECPVVDWEQGLGVGKIYYETFLDYFKARLEESLEFL